MHKYALGREMPEGVGVEVEGWGCSGWGGENLYSEKPWASRGTRVVLRWAFPGLTLLLSGPGKIGNALATPPDHQ